MTNAEKRALATARELELLQSAVKAFDKVIDDAVKLANECRTAVSRLEAIERESHIDELIDDLDRRMGRGKYADDLNATIIDIASYRSLSHE